MVWPTKASASKSSRNLNRGRMDIISGARFPTDFQIAPIDLALSLLPIKTQTQTQHNRTKPKNVTAPMVRIDGGCANTVRRHRTDIPHAPMTENCQMSLHFSAPIGDLLTKARDRFRLPTRSAFLPRCVVSPRSRFCCHDGAGGEGGDPYSGSRGEQAEGFSYQLFQNYEIYSAYVFAFGATRLPCGCLVTFLL